MTSTTHPIYTALNVPTVTAYPSINCLQWSLDSQLFLTTKNAVYIMTPDHGIRFDTSSAIKSIPPKQDLHEDLALSWFRTAVQTSTASISYHWPEYSQTWGTTSLGSIDVDLVASILSPTGVSPSGGCILAILSSNMDLTLWTAAKNLLKGEWIKIFDVIPFLLETLFLPESGMDRAAMTLKCQITSMAWTSQADFQLHPTPTFNASLLLLGNRSGSIHILRYTIQSSLQLLESIPVADKWVTNLAASSWSLVDAGICELCVAYGQDNGVVGLLKIRQALKDSPTASTFGFGQSIKMEVQTTDECILQSDGCQITAMTWVNIQDGRMILVSCKPGFVYLWCNQPEPQRWTGLVTLKVPSLTLSIGSSPRHPASGIQYISKNDTLIVTTYDGSFHVIKAVSVAPSWSKDGDSSSGFNISGDVRSISARVEGKQVQLSDMVRVPGAISYQGHHTLVWAYEISRPALFMYKHEAQTYTKIIVADIGPKPTAETIITELQAILCSSQSMPGLSTLSILRPSFFNLRQTKHMKEIFPKILQFLSSPSSDPSLLIQIEGCPVPLNDEIRKEFRDSLRRHLFGWIPFRVLRLRLSVADFLWKLCPNEQDQADCGTAAQSLLTSISHVNLRILIRHTLAGAELLTEQDIPFVLRLIVQSMLPGTPSDLNAEGQQLSTIIQTKTGTGPQVFMSVDAFNESCPACGGSVALTDITIATCANGHTWDRCSVTTFILATSFLRTCIGCTRKAFLPLSSNSAASIGDDQPPPNWLPDIGHGWIVEELLEAVDHCLFCGNSFVSVLL